MSSRMYASPKADYHGVLNAMTDRHHSSSSIHVCSTAGCEASSSSWDEGLSMESRGETVFLSCRTRLALLCSLIVHKIINYRRPSQYLT